MRDVLANEPLAEVDYLSVADTLTMAELEWIDDGALLSLAVRFGQARLIDNEPWARRPPSEPTTHPP